MNNATDTQPPAAGTLRLGQIEDEELQLLDYFASAARADELSIPQDPAACAALVGVSADDYSDAHFYALLAREKYRYAIAMMGARRRLHEQIAEDAERLAAANDAEAAPAAAAPTEH